MKDLEEAGCIEIEDNFHLKSTQLGNIIIVIIVIIIIIMIVIIRKNC